MHPNLKDYRREKFSEEEAERLVRDLVWEDGDEDEDY